MVGDDEIRCSGSVLRKLFSEEKLILVYRFAFEIEKAKTYFDHDTRTPAGGDKTDESRALYECK